MADLENLLLEAAGRTGAQGRNRHSRLQSRRQHEVSFSDGSDSNDDNSDDNPGYTSRKPSGSQVPLKKRLDTSEKDEDHGDDDYGDDDDGRMGSGTDESDVGSDLYKGDDDREQLAQMTELDREMILSERAQRRDDQRLTERVRGKQIGKKAQPVKEAPPMKAPTPSSRVRSSARFAEKATAKDDALNELRAKRLKQQDPDGHRKMRDTGRRSSVGRNSSPVRRNSSRAASPSSDSNQSEGESGSNSKDEESADDLGESDDEGPTGEEALTLEDIKEITIRRSKLAKWFMEPFFEELIVGCFVRVGIGRRNNKSYYRLCMVKNVDATTPHLQYSLENKKTHKYLNVTWGNKEARWQMAVISESPPLEVEFTQWVKAMEDDRIRLPTRQDVLEKKEAIHKAVTYVYSPATVKQMLQEKKSASSRPLNIAAEKDRLRRELDGAESRRDVAEKERIQARLLELDTMSRQAKHKDDKAVKLEEMNKKNRAENFRNASEMKPVNTSLKAGEAGYDPFSRRWTRSRNYYVSNAAAGDEAAASANGDADSASLEPGENNGMATGATKEAGMATTAAALEAAAGAGKLVDTSAPIDLGIGSNSMHNFELEISLNKLQMFGGPQGAHAGFMARKQKVEATVGCRVPENDGRRHSLTLSVGDYKRRRGLL